MPSRPVKRTDVMTLTISEIDDLVSSMRARGVEAFRFGELEVKFRDEVGPVRTFSWEPQSIELEAPPKEGEPATRALDDETLFFSAQ